MSQAEQTNEKKLKQLRTEIDVINSELISLLSKRGELAHAIGIIKSQQGRPCLYDPEREKQQLQQLVKINPGPFQNEEIEAIFRQIFKACLELEEKRQAEN